MSSAQAWLLECSETLIVAVADHEIVECIQPDAYHEVPSTPPYCNRVIQWQGRLVPVLDLGALYGSVASLSEPSFVCLLAYQEAPGLPLQHLAVPVNSAPEKVEVDDEQACELAEGPGDELLRAISISCFSHAQVPVAIVDIARLCSREFRELALAS